MNLFIISHLEEVAERLDAIGEPMRSKAFADSASRVRRYPNPINTKEDLKLVGLGARGLEVSSEFLEYGFSKYNENLVTRTPQIARRKTDDIEKEQFREFLKSIHGIGPKRADDFVEKGYRKLEDVVYNEKLTPEIRKGIYWHEHIAQKIPREEIDYLRGLITEAWKNIGDLRWEIVGSYRRGLPQSSDIDILVMSESSTIEDLVSRLGGLIVDTLKMTPELYNGMIQISPAHWAHRIDIRSATPETWAYKLFYFTGSKDFNKAIRQYVKSHGYTMNEFEMKNISTGEKVPARSEEDIFAFINTPWIPPENRV
jgi:DNA polymerase/3'-5' exonuclease PolX